MSAAPFQIWAPDVYQGAPTPVTAFLSTGPKAAAFAVFLRIFMTVFEPGGGGWEPLVWFSALASMTIGNFAALRQSNVKRMLAYSSIAHAGYVLVALTARSGVGASAAMFWPGLLLRFDHDLHARLTGTGGGGGARRASGGGTHP